MNRTEPKKILELLAPAGNMNQACHSIESGCDAVYGGLANWNARMRAGNFSVDEYKRLMEICRRRGVKFYMTLNTLFKDTELDALLELLANVNFVLPDAVIVADVGLMALLTENFPTLDVHASTQYGAYTVDDIKFLERYNVKRVILARELTLDEIKKIRAATDIELEVFCYGSQCICFSGQCLWSGLTQECSGNRGRCLAPCRDFYRQKNFMGQFLYPQDIDAETIVKELVTAGINSLKLEGRFRDSATTSSAIKRFRRAIDDWAAQKPTNTREDYLSYLGNEVPVKSMFHVLNPRVPLYEKSSTRFGEHDFLAKKNQREEPEIVFTGGHVDAENNFYIKTIFHEKLSPSNDGAWGAFSFKEGVLEKLEVFDNLGRQFTHELPAKNLIETTPVALVDLLKNSLSFKLREVSSNLPEFSCVKVNRPAFMSAIQKLNDTCEIVPRPQVNRVVVPVAEDYIRIGELSVMRYLKARGYRKFIFDVTSEEDLREVLSEDENDSVVYRLPLLDFSGCQENVLARLCNKVVMITRPMHLLYIKKYGFKKVFADYTLNIWNSKSLGILKNFGVEMLVAHPELALEESENIAQALGIQTGVTYAGRIPLGYTRACFKEMNLCGRKCDHSFFELENVTKDYKLQIRCNERLGCRALVPSAIFVAAADKITCQKIYNFSFMGEAEIDSILSGNINDVAQIATIHGRSVL